MTSKMKFAPSFALLGFILLMVPGQSFASSMAVGDTAVGLRVPVGLVGGSIGGVSGPAVGFGLEVEHMLMDQIGVDRGPGDERPAKSDSPGAFVGVDQVVCMLG